MGNKSRFAIAENSIKSFFLKGSQKIFSREQLRAVFEDKKSAWKLPIGLYADKFIEQLIKKEILKVEEILFDEQKKKELFVVGDDIPIFQIATSIYGKSYLSHYSAMYLNGLTVQVPKTIYITNEQSKKNGLNRTLTQESIDGAFSKPQRKSLFRTNYKGYVLVIHNGMNTNRLGLTSKDGVYFTNIERTLIDIAVRPNYAGGVFDVLEAYKKAIPNISINKLIAILNTLDFIYPYSQAIGFYLEKAGYDGGKLKELKNKRTEFDFYLTYEMKETNYSKEWKLFYPKGI